MVIRTIQKIFKKILKKTIQPEANTPNTTEKLNSLHLTSEDYYALQ